MNDDDAQIVLFHAAYHAVVEEFDREIGRILSALEDAGILEETLVIYCCDHGESARAHGNLGKCSMYEDSIGVPLIVAGPGMDRGRTESAVVSHLDLFPTIAEAVGLTPPTELRGRSLLTLLQYRDAAFDEAPVLSEFHAGNANHSAFALRQGAWKLVEHVHEDPILFNLDEDADEMHDLVRHEPEADRTRGQLHAMQATLRDICDPEAIDSQAKGDQRARKQELEAAGRLEEEVYQRSYERNTERLIP